jgi:glycerol-3-phosphate dehydrogenase
MQLSRRHVIETDPQTRHVTIFGGKLTDCLNVGEKLCLEAARLGVLLRWPKRAWYGEPPALVREEFLRQAELMGLDALAPRGSAEPPSVRLWRRYGAEAFSLLESIRRDPRSAEAALPPSDVLRCEVESAASREMVVHLEDFLRRRTEIAQLVRHEELQGSPWLPELCRTLFGGEAAERMREYVHKDDGLADTTLA